MILSNHVPELRSIVDGVGLGSLIDQVYTSAVTGYEKPNPESYRIALGSDPPEECFMVGDNVDADVLGAERKLGCQPSSFEIQVPTLHDLRPILRPQSPRYSPL